MTTLYLVKLVNEAVAYLVLSNCEQGVMLRVNIELGLKPGTLREEDMEILNLDNMRSNMVDERQYILKVVSL
jgi:hypothetical protein